ncbi:MAG: HD-GYP domain-containing protein, partial [Phycisphaerales bacterium]
DRYVYVILLTANSDRDSLIAGLNSGADDFVAKPFNMEELAVRFRIAQRVTSLETRDLTIFSLAKLAESRDPETGAHLERVRNYCQILSNTLATKSRHSLVITPQFVRLIYLTSPLHDIGKVGIPDAVLLKPGRLDEREYAIMKQHAQIGADTLGDALRMYPNAEFLRMARDIALTHHEQWDGSGYPNALQGDEIPLAGRIMALADVYDALRARRVYKPAHVHHVARDIILGARGTHFDPDLVEAFLACEGEIRAVADRFGESRHAAIAA